MNFKVVTPLLMIASLCLAQSDIPQAKYTAPTTNYDYDSREVMIPMRDGVKLHTVVVVPKGASRAPILLTRTPYNASKRTARFDSPHMLATLGQGDEQFVSEGYIRVFQDVRGKYTSEGDYVVTRPVRGPLNNTKVDHVTDAWDTIDWLVKNISESNGRVGMIGSSYEGFTVAMALLDPHPALKVAAPESPMVDGWMGDDWFQYGAFRMPPTLDYIVAQATEKSDSKPVQRDAYDDYEAFRKAGSAGDYIKAHGLDVFPFIKKITEHPSYDSFWQGQALDKLLAARPSKVPTIWLQGLWDQEDIWGGIHCFAALQSKGDNHLVIGPWRHSQVNYDAYNLGPIKWDGDTATKFRQEVLQPFFDHYLKDKAPQAQMPKVLVYNSGKNRWDHFNAWPTTEATKPLYLGSDYALSFAQPVKGDGADTYVSDPRNPVPYLPRPIRGDDREAWKQWMVTDQRFVDGRPDVLTYQTEVLKESVSVSGMPVVDLYASTTGSDADWVVKLIDVYPDEVPSRREMGGYQLPITLKIFRGRYRESFEKAAAITPGKVAQYRYELTPVNHVFLPGHRIMVQIQSSLFPLYDRNPQTFVPNIFWAKPSDFAKQTHTIHRSKGAASAIWLPVVN
jgi:putative CocE/NonD family hydrolase